MRRLGRKDSIAHDHPTREGRERIMCQPMEKILRESSIISKPFHVKFIGSTLVVSPSLFHEKAHEVTRDVIKRGRRKNKRRVTIYITPNEIYINCTIYRFGLTVYPMEEIGMIYAPPEAHHRLFGVSVKDPTSFGYRFYLYKCTLRHYEYLNEDIVKEYLTMREIFLKKRSHLTLGPYPPLFRDISDEDPIPYYEKLKNARKLLLSDLLILNKCLYSQWEEQDEIPLSGSRILSDPDFGTECTCLANRRNLRRNAVVRGREGERYRGEPDSEEEQNDPHCIFHSRRVRPKKPVRLTIMAQLRGISTEDHQEIKVEIEERPTQCVSQSTTSLKVKEEDKPEVLEEENEESEEQQEVVEEEDYVEKVVEYNIEEEDEENGDEEDEVVKAEEQVVEEEMEKEEPMITSASVEVPLDVEATTSTSLVSFPLTQRSELVHTHNSTTGWSILSHLSHLRLNFPPPSTTANTDGSVSTFFHCEMTSSMSLRVSGLPAQELIMSGVTLRFSPCSFILSPCCAPYEPETVSCFTPEISSLITNFEQHLDLKRQVSILTPCIAQSLTETLALSSHAPSGSSTLSNRDLSILASFAHTHTNGGWKVFAKLSQVKLHFPPFSANTDSSVNSFFDNSTYSLSLVLKDVQLIMSGVNLRFSPCSLILSPCNNSTPIEAPLLPSVDVTLPSHPVILASPLPATKLSTYDPSTSISATVDTPSPKLHSSSAPGLISNTNADEALFISQSQSSGSSVLSKTTEISDEEEKINEKQKVDKVSTERSEEDVPDQEWDTYNSQLELALSKDSIPNDGGTNGGSTATSPNNSTVFQPPLFTCSAPTLNEGEKKKVSQQSVAHSLPNVSTNEEWRQHYNSKSDLLKNVLSCLWIFSRAQNSLAPALIASHSHDLTGRRETIWTSAASVLTYGIDSLDEEDEEDKEVDEVGEEHDVVKKEEAVEEEEEEEEEEVDQEKFEEEMVEAVEEDEEEERYSEGSSEQEYEKENEEEEGEDSEEGSGSSSEQDISSKSDREESNSSSINSVTGKESREEVRVPPRRWVSPHILSIINQIDPSLAPQNRRTSIVHPRIQEMVEIIEHQSSFEEDGH